MYISPICLFLLRPPVHPRRMGSIFVSSPHVAASSQGPHRTHVATWTEEAKHTRTPRSRAYLAGGPHI